MNLSNSHQGVRAVDPHQQINPRHMLPPDCPYYITLAPDRSAALFPATWRREQLHSPLLERLAALSETAQGMDCPYHPRARALSSPI